MNQSIEIETPYEGQKFSSFDELKKYLEEYGQRNFVKFWIRSSHKRNSLKSRISKTMNPDLKYVSVKFACIFGGEKIRCRGSGIRKSSTYRNLGCPCMINAVVGDDGNHVKLDTVILEHNHVLCKTLYDSLKKTKRKNSKTGNDVTENVILMNNQDLKLNNIDEMIYAAKDKVEVEINKEKNINSKNEAEDCLKDLKDKYGKNMKILVVNPENLNNKEESNFKDDVQNNTFVSDNEDEIKELLGNFSEICRLCLSSENKLFPIFNPALPLKSTVLSFKIMGCASIEISADDGLPNNICSACKADLDVAYNFRIKCENSDSLLRKACLRNNILHMNSSISGSPENGIIFEVSEEKALQENCVYQEKNEDAIEKDLSTQESFYDQLAISCPLCGDTFEKYESMLSHLEIHSEDQSILLPCNICNMIYPTVKDLQEHIKEHLKEKLEYDHNEFTFCEFEKSKNHEERRDQTRKSEINFLCNVCGKILKTKDRFQAHKNTHEGLRPHICLKCGRGFADRKNMHQHYDVVHLRRVKHECPVCQKKFYTRTKMNSHITMHYGVKPFACEICNKTFRLKMNMIKHKKTHSNERPYQCDKCNAAFIDKNMLKRHSYIHGGIRPYPCPICGHRFSVKFHLKKHLEKSKCSKGVMDTENYQWVGMTQANTNLPEGECVVVYKTDENSTLQTDPESVTINMDILQDYSEDPNS